MRASQARWALVMFSTLGLAGCQTGKPTWWPGRNKTPAYSTSSTTPPAGATQHPLPSSQVAPYGMEGQQDANQYAQQTSGVTGGADGYGGNGYGANNYAATAGQDAYGNATAGVPQNGPYEGYQQPAGGGYAGAAGGGYGGATGGGYAGGQVNNPYAGAGAGGAGYNDYQAQQQGGYATQQTAGGYQTAGAGQTSGGYQTAGGYQGGAATDPAGGNPAYSTADARYGQPQGYDNAASSGANSQYNTAGPGYVGGATTPEQSPYSQASDAAWSQGTTTPGNTGYQPGATGYNPPGTQPYQSPAGNYNPDPNGTQADPHYRPGGTSDYTPGAGGATNSAATSYAATAAGNNGAGGYADTSAATANRYPSATTSTSRYPNSPTEDRYGRPTTANASAAGTTGGYYPQR